MDEDNTLIKWYNFLKSYKKNNDKNKVNYYGSASDGQSASNHNRLSVIIGEENQSFFK